ncbi:TOMM precursor leader peptide-binding protein [Streptomyces sp. NPDC004069]
MAPTLPVIATGGFGERVGRVLSGLRPGTELLEVTQLRRAIEKFSGPVVLAAWRPEPALFRRLDSMAHEAGRSWLPVVLETAVVRVGPLVRPAQAPCFRCYERRRSQHDLQAPITALLKHRYDRDPSLGPGGFLPHHARAAAAVAAAYADGAPGTGPGLVSTVRLREWGVDADRVVPWHGCERCDVGAADRGALQRLTSALPAPGPRRQVAEVRR